MNVANEAVYILHTRDYRESSQLVDVFSRHHGRLRMVARGTRGGKKSSASKLQAFTPLLVSWQGKAELKKLTAVEAAGNRFFLRGEALYLGLYLNELLMRLLPEHIPQQGLFDIYGELVAELTETFDTEPLLRRFELRLLEEIGYGLDLSFDWNEGAPIMAKELYHFYTDQGFVRFDSASGLSSKFCFEGAHLLAIASQTYQQLEVRRSAKRLLRSALQSHLGAKPLLSRELFRQVCVAVNDIETDAETGKRG